MGSSDWQDAVTDDQPQQAPPALVPITEAAKELGIGRDLAYRLARETGELLPGLPVLRIGSLLKVTRAQLTRICEGDIGSA